MLVLSYDPKHLLPTLGMLVIVDHVGGVNRATPFNYLWPYYYMLDDVGGIATN